MDNYEALDALEYQNELDFQKEHCVEIVFFRKISVFTATTAFEVWTDRMYPHKHSLITFLCISFNYFGTWGSSKSLYCIHYTVYETADRKRNVRIMKCRIFLFCYTGDTPKVSLGLQTSFGHCKPLNIGFSLTCRDCTVPKVFRIRACQGWRVCNVMSL